VQAKLTPLGMQRWYAVIVVLLAEFSSLSQAQNPKILCLHGGGGRPTEMASSAGVQALQRSLPGYEFVFAQGGYPTTTGYVWVTDPPGGKGQATTDPNIAAQSVDNLDRIVAEQGPFYGILGYSQGSAFVSVYLAHAPVGTFQVAMMFCGYIPTTHQGLVDNINAASPFGGVTALVWMGETDFIITNPMTEAQAAKYTSPTIVRSPQGGHAIPSEDDSTYNQVVAFVTNNPPGETPSSATSSPTRSALAPSPTRSPTSSPTPLLIVSTVSPTLPPTLSPSQPFNPPTPAHTNPSTLDSTTPPTATAPTYSPTLSTPAQTSHPTTSPTPKLLTFMPTSSPTAAAPTAEAAATRSAGLTIGGASSLRNALLSLLVFVATMLWI